MRETKFIQQNKEKWRNFEQILRQTKKDPDKLSELFIQITNDLSYSRTFYPFRSVKVYLNGLAQSVFLNIYKNKKGNRRRLIDFWLIELPQIAFQCRRELIISVLAFWLAMAIGIISSIYDADFCKIILGDDYVNMTLENIDGGDPMAVYKSMNQVDMFLGITYNNLLVAFRTFIMGIVLAIGSLFILIYNGIMVGAFQFFFIERGLFWESFLTIWLHGTLEISSIIIAGASGLVLGKGLVFPGTLSRLQSFQISAIRGLKLLLGIAPILTFAAVIESFVTRYTEMPDILKGFIIAISFIFIVFYFIYFPWKLSKKAFKTTDQSAQLAATSDQSITIKDRILSNADVFKNIFVFYRQNIRNLVLFNLVFMMTYIGLAFFVLYPELKDDAYLSGWIFWKVSFLYDYNSYPLFLILNSLLFTSNIFLALFYLRKELNKDESWNWKYGLSNFLKIFLLVGVLNLTLYLPGILTTGLLFFCIPFLLTTGFIYFYERLNIINGLNSAIKLYSGKYGRVFNLYTLLFLLSLFLYLFADSPLLNNYLDVLEMNFSNDFTYRYLIMLVLKTSITTIALLLTFTILTIGMGISYFSLKEIDNANGLKQRILNIGKGVKKYGIQS